jgi:signal transduction histidine kinase
MNHHAAPPSVLCQALIAHDACATLVLDVEERLVAWNDAAAAAFNVYAPARGRSIAESGVAARMPSLHKALETVRAGPGLGATPGDDISVAPFILDDELVGFIVRRAESNRALAISAELTVARADLEATRSELHTSSLDLAAANDALRTANEDLHRRIEELQAAAVAERHKDEFLAMLAHELRTPLAPILSAVQILRRQATDNPVVQRAREVVERQALHQARLLDDLLDVSRITRGKIELRRRPVSIGAAVTEAIEDTRGLIQAKAQTLAVSLPEPPLFVDADPTS